MSRPLMDHLFKLPPLPPMPDGAKRVRTPAAWALALAIRLYKRYISAGREFCKRRWTENCSTRALQVVRMFGAVQGARFICGTILTHVLRSAWIWALGFFYYGITAASQGGDSLCDSFFDCDVCN